MNSTPTWTNGLVDLYVGDTLASMKTMSDQSVQACVTSPPYWGLRDYGHEGQIGLEDTPEAYVQRMVEVFREVRRVLRDDGTLWLNLGDSYNGSGGAGGDGKQHTNQGSVTRPDNRAGWSGLKHKDLVGIPWRVAFALQSDGWYLRQDIIWHKPNPMPESVRDRCTKAHEYVFLLSKSEKYYFDTDAVAEPATYPGDNRAARRDTRKEIDPFCKDGGSRARTGNPTGETRNRRSVWTILTKPYSGAHFAVFPPELPRLCIAASTKHGDTVLDPFGGSGTTGMVATEMGRKAVLCELNPDYAEIIKGRVNVTPGLALDTSPE